MAAIYLCTQAVVLKSLSLYRYADSGRRLCMSPVVHAVVCERYVINVHLSPLPLPTRLLPPLLPLYLTAASKLRQ